MEIWNFIMKKWIIFKFKNPLKLYLFIIWIAVGFLSFVMIKQKNYLPFVALLILGVFATVGCWFGLHYGIRISKKSYLLICNHGIGLYKKEKVTGIDFYFIQKSKTQYDVRAKVFIVNKSPKEFVWTDFYTRQGGMVRLDVKLDFLESLVENLTQDEKISARIITC